VHRVDRNRSADEFEHMRAALDFARACPRSGLRVERNRLQTLKTGKLSAMSAHKCECVMLSGYALGAWVPE
jgi:hypothetical protein